MNRLTLLNNFVQIEQIITNQTSDWIAKKNSIETIDREITEGFRDVRAPIAVIHEIAINTLKFWVLSICTIGIYAALLYSQRNEQIRRFKSETEDYQNLKFMYQQVKIKALAHIQLCEKNYLDTYLGVEGEFIKTRTNALKSDCKRLFAERNDEVKKLKTAHVEIDKVNQEIFDIKKKIVYQPDLPQKMTERLTENDVKGLTELQPISKEAQYMTELKQEVMLTKCVKRGLDALLKIAKNGFPSRSTNSMLIPPGTVVFNERERAEYLDDPIIQGIYISSLCSLIALDIMHAGRIEKAGQTLYLKSMVNLYPSQTCNVLSVKDDFEYITYSANMHLQSLIMQNPNRRIHRINPIGCKKLLDTLSDSEYEILMVLLLSPLIKDDSEVLRINEEKMVQLDISSKNKIVCLKIYLEEIAKALTTNKTVSNFIKDYAKNAV